MNWMEISVATTTAGIEPVTGVLLQIGIGGFVIEDREDFKEFLQEVTPHWDYVDEALMKKAEEETAVKFYLPDDVSGRQTLALAREALAALKRRAEEDVAGSLALSIGSVREEDWEWGWKQYFKPFPVGERLLVCPTWEDPGDIDGRQLLLIDPGSSFGTGQHQTTRLCLELLEELVSSGCRMLDLGTGSGILAIAGLLLGADRVTAVDIDEHAVRSAEENTKRNGLDLSRMEFYAGDVTNDRPLRERLGVESFDLITANIVADVLIAMAPCFDSFLRLEGRLIVSGIIEERAEEVFDALSACGFLHIDTKTDGGWAAAVFEKTGRMSGNENKRKSSRTAR